MSLAILCEVFVERTFAVTHRLVNKTQSEKDPGRKYDTRPAGLKAVFFYFANSCSLEVHIRQRSPCAVNA